MRTTPLDEPMHFNDNELVIKEKNPLFQLVVLSGCSLRLNSKATIKVLKKGRHFLEGYFNDFELDFYFRRFRHWDLDFDPELKKNRTAIRRFIGTAFGSFGCGTGS